MTWSIVRATTRIMTHPLFFGYGSLVNRATHDYPDARTTRLDGWRRIWVRTEGREIAYLSARPSEGHEIDGLMAAVPNADWAELDLRETGYDRLRLGTNTNSWIYSVPEALHVASGDHVILLSYLDVVAQGFLREFGEKGVGDFFATTDGWDTPILNDRSDPRYPRHQMLSKTETEMVDDHLSALSARIK
ncbi:MAG: gamma-glutamylcyclotransferase family protein [Pseudomonadota bacterium]